jgi:mannosyltransferase
VSIVTDPDQTVVLPRQRAPTLDEEPSQDPWLVVPAVGIAPVGGLDRSDAALSRLAWLLTTVFMAAVGLVRASWSSLSADELTTWAMANTSWSELWLLRTEIDAPTAPYYALIRAWAEAFGTSEFSLRLPSLLAMVAAAGVTAAIVSRLVSPRAGMLVGLLFTAVPATSRYGHEAGPEALAIAFAVLATAALVHFFERPRFWRWLGYASAVALLGLAHGAALFLLLGHAGAVLALRRRVLFGWLPAAMLGAAPAVGLLFVGRRPWQLVPWQDPIGMPSAPAIAGGLFGLALLGGLVAGLSMIGLSLKKPAGVFTTAALLPLAGLYPATEFTDLALPELVLFTLPFWLCLAAMALSRAPLVRGLTAVVVVALVGLPAQLDIRADDGHGLGARDLGEVLTAQFQPGDAILFGPTRRDEQIGRDLLARYVAAGARPNDALAESTPRTGGRLYAQECVDVDFCLGDAPRVWLFRADQQPNLLDGLPAAKDGVLRVRYQLTRTWTFRGASLALFTLAPADLDQPAPR